MRIKQDPMPVAAVFSGGSVFLTSAGPVTMEMETRLHPVVSNSLPEGRRIWCGGRETPCSRLFAGHSSLGIIHAVATGPTEGDNRFETIRYKGPCVIWTPRETRNLKSATFRQ